MTVPFFMTTVILTLTVLLGKVLKLVELFLTHDVSFVFIFGFVLSIIPSFMIYIIPSSFLVAVLIALTRLSSDNEIIAMKASGLSLYSVIRPVFFLAALATTLTLALTLYLYPYGNQNLKELLFEMARTKTTSGIEEKTFYSEFPGVVIYIDHIPVIKDKSVDKDPASKMSGIFISKENTAGETQLIFAKNGSFLPSSEELMILLKLEDGTIHRKNQNDATYHIVEFSSYTMELDMGGAGIKSKDTGSTPKRRRVKSSRELYTWELIERIKEYEGQKNRVARLTTDLHKRFALPASTILFALIGIPLGIQRVRSPKFTGFVLALGVILGYYVISKSFEALGENSSINPILAAWGSNIVFAVIGVVMITRAARDRDNFSVMWLMEKLRQIASFLKKKAQNLKKDNKDKNNQG
ncbi:MAG: LPS export ABC transporter permease LptF [Deltaproteobacteria bacterium]|nr:LPS export ABC transporter permease LptF [Deltaproteobacteria bacterium]